MDRFEIGLIGVAATFILALMRMPIGIALASTSFLGLWALTNVNAAFGMLKAVPYQFVANWSFSAVPMFLLMGFVASQSGLTSGLFRMMRAMLHRVPGGLACASVGACALFASASGSSVATAAAMGRIAIPEMRTSGYAYSLATGCVAAAGTLGSLIPPSVIFVIYGVFTQAPIGQLFIAGIIPGVLTALLYIAVIIVSVTLKPSLAPSSRDRPERGELRSAIFEAWPLPVLVIGVIGGIYAGITTPTEAGAVGASLACIIALVRRTLSLRVLYAALRDTVVSTSSLFVIAMGAAMFTTFMGLAGLPATIASALKEYGTDPLVLILLVSLIYLVLGMFIDSLGIMLLTLPILLPVLIDADINLIWFGVLVVKLLEIGMITPPFGLNIFVIHSQVRHDVALTTIFKGTMMFIAMELLLLALIITWPGIVLWLPSQMK